MWRIVRKMWQPIRIMLLNIRVMWRIVRKMWQKLGYMVLLLEICGKSTEFLPILCI